MNVLAIVFPGQGSQKKGMLSEFSEDCVFRETFIEASNVLNYDLWDLIQYGPVEELNKTYRAQPAILSASVAIWRIWRNRGGKIPRFMAGHSLGEYSALVCSGVINFSDAVKLVELRGMLMQDVISSDIGIMSAIIGLDEDVVISVCKEISSNNQIVSLSAFNAPKHVVISGHRKSVEDVNVICKKLGASIFILPISVPSHCELMLSVVPQLQIELEKIKFLKPCISVVNNVDVRVENSKDAIKRALMRQLYTPVRWREVIEYLIKCNVDLLVEIGPGKILSTMANRTVINTNLLSISVNDFFSLNLAMKY